MLSNISNMETSSSTNSVHSDLFQQYSSNIAKLNEVFPSTSLTNEQEETLAVVVNGYKHAIEELEKYRNIEDDYYVKRKKPKISFGVRLSKEALGAFQFNTLKLENAQNLFARSIVSLYLYI